MIGAILFPAIGILGRRPVLPKFEMSLARSVPQHLGSNSNYGGGWCAPTSNGQPRSGCVLLSSNRSGAPTLTAGSNLGQTQRSRDSNEPSRQIVRNLPITVALELLCTTWELFTEIDSCWTMRTYSTPKAFLTASLSKSVLYHLHPRIQAVGFTYAHDEGRTTHLAVTGKSFWKFKPSTSNQVVALLFYVVNAKSATVALSTRQPEGRFARTDSKTPKTRLISLSYRSTVLGTFSLWNFWNRAAWPKYGLCGSFYPRQ